MMLSSKIILRFAIIGLLIQPNCSWAQEDESNHQPIEENTPIEEDDYVSLNEVNGLIIDRTMTRIGRTFYSEFAQRLNESESDLRENFTVTERTTARFGTIITIWHSHKIVFRTSLSPRAKESKEQAEAAVKVLKSYLVRWKIQRLYSDTFDLARDEL